MVVGYDVTIYTKAMNYDSRILSLCYGVFFNWTLIV
jgi:hypothetical protein